MIAIVGGGISGLALGWELQTRGVDFTIFEAGPRAGGVIRTGMVDGRVLDWGPQRIRLTQAMSRLISDVGLADEVVHAPAGLDLFVYRGGRLRAVPFTPGAFLTSDIVSLGAKLRLLLEPFTRGPDPEESVASFFERKIGPELYRTLVAPLYGGLYASDPAEMQVGLSLIHVLREFGIGRSLLLPLLRRGGRIHAPRACNFKEGMETLPRALASALGDRLELESPVEKLEPRGEDWSIQVAGREVRADAVVLTAPAPVTAGLLADAAPRSAEKLRQLRYNPLGVVHLDAETDLEGLGFQVAFTEDLFLRGVTFNDSLFGRPDVYTAYLGGARHPEVEGMGAEQLAEIAEDEFERCTGFEARTLSVEHERMPAWDSSWRALTDFELPDGIHVAANWWSRPGLPGRLAEAGRVAATLCDTVSVGSAAARRVSV